MRVSISEWSGDWLAFVFLAPIKPSKRSNKLYHPCPKNISWFFHNPSVKHHLPWLDGTIVATGNQFWSIPCASEVYASAQSNDSVSASLRVSLGWTSKILNTLLFLPFHMYYKIQANWWSSNSTETLQNKWSLFANNDYVGNMSGIDGTLESTQTWTSCMA